MWNWFNKVLENIPLYFGSYCHNCIMLLQNCRRVFTMHFFFGRHFKRALLDWLGEFGGHSSTHGHGSQLWHDHEGMIQSAAFKWCSIGIKELQDYALTPVHHLLHGSLLICQNVTPQSQCHSRNQSSSFSPFWNISSMFLANRSST